MSIRSLSGFENTPDQLQSAKSALSQIGKFSVELLSNEDHLNALNIIQTSAKIFLSILNHENNPVGQEVKQGLINTLDEKLNYLLNETITIYPDLQNKLRNLSQVINFIAVRAKVIPPPPKKQESIKNTYTLPLGADPNLVVSSQRVAANIAANTQPSPKQPPPPPPSKEPPPPTFKVQPPPPPLPSTSTAKPQPAITPHIPPQARSPPPPPPPSTGFPPPLPPQTLSKTQSPTTSRPPPPPSQPSIKLQSSSPKIPLEIAAIIKKARQVCDNIVTEIGGEDGKKGFDALKKNTDAIYKKEQIKLASFNPSRDRFTNILHPESTITGMNANFIKDEKGVVKHIAAQAPKIDPNSANIQSERYWLTLIKQDVGVVVDLTNNTDYQEKDPAPDPSTFYPTEQVKEMTFNDVKIRLAKDQPEQSSRKDIKITKYEVFVGTSKEPKIITRVNYTGWIDHGPPNDQEALSELNKEVDKAAADAATNSKSKETKPKVLTYCRAGVGRTGTFITYRELTDKVDSQVFKAFANELKTKSPKEQSTEIYKKMEKMLGDLDKIILDGRRDRGPYFVQGPVQYKHLLDQAKSKFMDALTNALNPNSTS